MSHRNHLVKPRTDSGKRSWARILGAWLGLLCLLLLPSTIRAAPQWLSYTQSARLQTNGALYVNESIGLRLPVGAEGVTRMLTPPEGQTIVLESVFWQEEDRPLVSVPLASEENKTAVGSYALSENNHVLTVEVSFPPAEDQRNSTLHLRYTLSTPGRRYLDVGTLDWQPLGPRGLPASVSSVSANLTLGTSDNGQVLAALQSTPPHAELSIENGLVLLDIPGVSARRAAHVRVDFPTFLLAHQEALPESILPQRAAAQQAAVRSLSLGLSWALSCFLAGLLLTIFFYHKADKDPRAVAAQGNGMLGVSAPAELSGLMPFATGAGPHDFSAMLLHLIHRGHLRLYPPRRGLSLSPETISAARVERIAAPRDTLTDGEYFLIHYLVDVLGDGKSVALSDIHDAEPRAFRKDFRAWRQLVDRQLTRRPWFVPIDPQRITLCTLGGLLFFGTLIVMLMGAHPAAWLGAAIGLWLMCYAFLMRKRTPQAMHEIEIWRTFQRKLAVGGIGRVDSISQWERILLYGEAMKMGDLAAYALAERVVAGATYPDAETATFLAWGLSDYPDQLEAWFTLLTEAIRPR